VKGEQNLPFQRENVMTTTKKEKITPPSKKELTEASKQLKKGKTLGGRVMAEESVAVRQGAAKPKKK
jgi:hypothetical protein